MQFNVPQFLEIEDKIIGPLTLKQFGYLAGGGSVIFLAYFYAPTKLIFVLVSIPITLFAFAMAFVKINGRPFIYFLGSFINYFLKPKLFVWKKKSR
jgi:hypothetical protein